MDDRPLEVKVWGGFAVFSRPEQKVERVSYPMMTPSSARGVLEAIFWKPEFSWRVSEIGVLPYPGRKGSAPVGVGGHLSIVRNEVTDRAIAGNDGLIAAEARTQRHSMLLRDVAYLIRADVSIRPGVGEHPAKFRDQFRRRVEKGKCFHRPYLGCREFAADFGPVDGTEVPVDWTEDLGLMLGEVEHHPQARIPRFFSAKVERGVLRVPPELYAGMHQ